MLEKPKSSTKQKPIHQSFSIKQLSPVELEAMKMAHDINMAVSIDKRKNLKIEQDLRRLLLDKEPTSDTLENSGSANDSLQGLDVETPQRDVNSLPFKRVRMIDLDMFNVSSFTNCSNDSLSRATILSQGSDLDDVSLYSDDSKLTLAEKYSALEDKVEREKAANEEFEKELENLIAEGNMDLFGR